jgi:hypothetical protein
LDRALEGLARRQHGVFHRRQALRIGFTTDMIESRLASGAWMRVGGDVYGFPTHDGTWHRQCIAATLTVPGGAAARRTAANLYDAPTYRPGRIEVVTRRGTTHRSPLAKVIESKTVGRLSVVHGIRVVSKADCTIQLARISTLERLRSVVHHFDRRNRRYLDDLRDRQLTLERSRLPGMRKLRLVLRELSDDVPPTDSDLEVELRTLVDSIPSLGPVAWQAPLPFWPPGKSRCDGLAMKWPLILEADGRAWHTRVEDFERDHERDNLANVNGYDVLRFTYNQLTRHRSDCRRVLVAYVAHRVG